MVGWDRHPQHCHLHVSWFHSFCSVYPSWPQLHDPDSSVPGRRFSLPETVSLLGALPATLLCPHSEHSRQSLLRMQVHTRVRAHTHTHTHTAPPRPMLGSPCQKQPFAVSLNPTTFQGRRGSLLAQRSSGFLELSIVTSPDGFSM